MRILAVFGCNAYGDPARGEGYEHANILPDLTAIAGADGVVLFDCWDRAPYDSFAGMNLAFVKRVAQVKPDVVFLVLMGGEIWTQTLDAVRTNSPAALVHWGTDDSWKYAEHTRFIARHVDLHITTHEGALAKAKRDGLDNVVLSQWAACGAKLAAPLASAQCQYDVSFVGAAYGNRPAWVEALRALGIKVACFGKGWEGGVVAAAELPRIVQSSRISLNFSDSGLKLTGSGLARSRQIKARTFEVPGAGGFLLTEPAGGLGRYFEIGREIATYSSAGELAERIGYFLAHPGERDEMAQRAHERVAAEHTYAARLPVLLAEGWRRAVARGVSGWTLDAGLLDDAVRAHACGPVLRSTAAALTGMARLALGEPKGPRAARRLVHEVSWRLARARTYSAAGWPGRMFYHE